MLDLKRLGHVIALVEERHFARAAERVHLSQPAFSRSIQSIERDVGMRLFDRETGDVKPTAAGAFLAERARTLLFDARSLQRDTALYRDSQLGDTAFGVGPFPAATLLPAVAIALRQRYPAIGVRVEVNNWQLLLERLLAEDIEFFVADVRDLPQDRRIEVWSLGRQPAHFYVRGGHPLVGRECTCAEAWRFGMGTIRLPSAMRQLLSRLLGLPHGRELPVAMECDDISLLRTLALCTDTVIAVADAAVREEVAAGRLVRLSMQDLPAVYADMGIVALANRTPSPMAQRAIACIRDVATSTNPAAPTAQRSLSTAGAATADGSRVEMPTAPARTAQSRVPPG